VEGIVTNAGKADDDGAFERSVKLWKELAERWCKNDCEPPDTDTEALRNLAAFMMGFLTCVMRQQAAAGLVRNKFLTERARTNYVDKASLRAAREFGPVLGFDRLTIIGASGTVAPFAMQWSLDVMLEANTPVELVKLALRWADVRAQAPDPEKWIRTQLSDPTEWLLHRTEPAVDTQ
jgi:hypothetical protein